MRMTYANCFADDPGDVLVTDELAVARAAGPGTQTIVADERYDAETAQGLNQRLAALAYGWGSFADGDPTVVHGISAADLAGQEALLTLLLPAARGVLDMEVALADAAPSALDTVVAAGGGETFQRIETVTCEAAEATAEARLGPGVVARRRVSRDERNEALQEKYARTRNPDFLPEESRADRALARGACLVANLAAAVRPGRRRPVVAVYQYNPTAAFARGHAGRADRRFALARYRFGREDLVAMLRAGDRGLAPTGGRPRGAAGAVAGRLDDALRRHDATLRESFTVAGVDLWPVLGPRLRELVARYAEWIDARAPAVLRGLRSARARAVLVPFDGPPEARLLVRVAQATGIPTVVLNDGWKGDDHSTEGMTTDHALAWFRGARSELVMDGPRSREVLVTLLAALESSRLERPVDLA